MMGQQHPFASRDKKPQCQTEAQSEYNTEAKNCAEDYISIPALRWTVEFQEHR